MGSETSTSEPERKEFTVSPSRIVLFSQCNRKWWWEYVAGFKPPSSPGQNAGTAAHKEIENYILLGTEPPTPKIKEAIKHLPPGPYNEKHLVETWLTVALPGGVLNRQKADLVDLNGEVPHVVDVKTGKTMHFMLSEHQLRENIQMVSYAMAVLEKYMPNAENVKLSHLQIPLQSNESPAMVSVLVTVDELKTRWLKIQADYIERMKVLHDETDPKKVEPNWNHCNAFGGCPHRDRCADVERGVEASVTTPVDELTISWIPKQAGLTVYVDCAPVASGDVVPLSEILAPVIQEIAKEHGDWRLVEYGKGKGMLAAALRKMSLPEKVYISSREDIASVGLEVLVPMCEARNLYRPRF